MRSNKNAPCPNRTEGDLNRGTTSGSLQPHGMQPHQVNQPGSAVSGAPGEAYFPREFGSLLKDVFTAVPLLLSPNGGSLHRG